MYRIERACYWKTLYLVPVILFSIFLSSCSQPAASETEMLKDLQEHPSFFSARAVSITGCDITKRRTDVDNFSDVVYLDVFAENDDIECVFSYIIHYELYNDGWVLESVERNYEEIWQIVPLHGMTDEEIQEKLDHYISLGWYDTVELVDRETELTDTGCTETVTLSATKEHLYGTEEFTLTQTWYFDSLICGYTAVLADPSVEECSVTLKDTIVGATWKCNRYHEQFSAWPDKFDFAVKELSEEDGKVWVKFIIHRTRNTYWDVGNREPVNWGVSSRFVVSSFLEYIEEEGMWGFNMEDNNEYLYSGDDDERFTENSWFCFSLDQSGLGYIIETDSI